MTPIENLERRLFFAAVTVNINTAQTLQTMEGMGAAMMPWTLRPEYTDPKFFDAIVNDLGASMARAAILPMAERVRSGPPAFTTGTRLSSSMRMRGKPKRSRRSRMRATSSSRRSRRTLSAPSGS